MAISNFADVEAIWNGPKVAQQVERAAGKGVESALYFFMSRLKELLSVPAPRKKTKYGYRATVPATPGAPPRKLSGAYRRSIAHKMDGGGRPSGIVGTPLKYPKFLEFHMDHKAFQVVLDRFRPELVRIVGGSIRGMIGRR